MLRPVLAAKYAANVCDPTVKSAKAAVKEAGVATVDWFTTDPCDPPLAAK